MSIIIAPTTAYAPSYSIAPTRPDNFLVRGMRGVTNLGIGVVDTAAHAAWSGVSLLGRTAVGAGRLAANTAVAGVDLLGRAAVGTARLAGDVFSGLGHVLFGWL